MKKKKKQYFFGSFEKCKMAFFAILIMKIIVALSSSRLSVKLICCIAFG